MHARQTYGNGTRAVKIRRVRRRARHQRRAYHSSATAYNKDPARRAFMRGCFSYKRRNVLAVENLYIRRGFNPYIVHYYAPAHVATRAEQHAELVARKRNGCVRAKSNAHNFAAIRVKSRRYVYCQPKCVFRGVQLFYKFRGRTFYRSI